MTEGKWIKFTEQSSSGKTKIFSVENKERETTIGHVKWYGAWRQYAFFPIPNTVYERQCLLDITKFLHHLMIDRKLTRQLQKGL